jgi:hypothetical protein
MEEGTGASISPKVASAMVARDGRNGRAMAEAIQIARGSTRVREESEWGLG